mmetsp:Transcript_3223/g.8945  ORF Transcript_3223/g.8945 Transcript_3223/m.8945 type:complete len:92 (+) Transcript_3223:1321-1596(+)
MERQTKRERENVASSRSPPSSQRQILKLSLLQPTAMKEFRDSTESALFVLSTLMKELSESKERMPLVESTERIPFAEKRVKKVTPTLKALK